MCAPAWSIFLCIARIRSAAPSSSPGKKPPAESGIGSMGNSIWWGCCRRTSLPNSSSCHALQHFCLLSLFVLQCFWSSVTATEYAALFHTRARLDVFSIFSPVIIVFSVRAHRVKENSRKIWLICVSYGNLLAAGYVVAHGAKPATLATLLLLAIHDQKGPKLRLGGSKIV